MFAPQATPDTLLVVPAVVHNPVTNQVRRTIDVLRLREKNNERSGALSETPELLIFFFLFLRCWPSLSQSHVVNWIESKAMFGDPAQHKDNFYQLEKYVERYGVTLRSRLGSSTDRLRGALRPLTLPASIPGAGRYGPGMVVYWFGYVEGLNNPNDDGWPWDDLILVVSRIPPEMRAR